MEEFRELQRAYDADLIYDEHPYHRSHSGPMVMLVELIGRASRSSLTKFASVRRATQTHAVAHPLDGCNAKLDRAHAAHAEYLATEPYVARATFDPTTNEIVYWGEVRHEPPLRIGVILGDLVHGLRSAPDHLVWQLVLANGKKPNDQNGFPVCTAATNWKKASGDKLARVQGAHAEMIEREQPFNAAKPRATPLARLNHLWNTDEHQVLVLITRPRRIPSGIPFIARPLGTDKFRPVRDIARVIDAEGY